MRQRIFRMIPLLVLSLFLISSPCAFAAKVEDDPELATAVVDNTVDLPDGVYTPDCFSFSGGSGKVKITCPEIIVENRLAFARIRFSSSSYAHVRASGKIFYADIVDGKSEFIIPIALNCNNRILGLTTKMGTPHEVEYLILVHYGESEISAPSDTLDDTAPQFTGFNFLEAVAFEQAENLRIFRYEPQALLFEIDTGVDPASALDEDKNLYQQRVLKYLAVPEGTELPAGAEKLYIIIRLPSTVCSLTDRTENYGLTPTLTLSPDNLDYRTLLLEKIQLVICDEALLPELREKLADRFTTLGIPVLVDCSTEETQDDWMLLYRLLNEEA